MSEILHVAHEMAEDLFKVGAMDEITIREIDALGVSTGNAVQCDACDSSVLSSKPLELSK